MKSNLAVLSSDNKTIQFIENNNLKDLCNLYANSSRNTDDAKVFSENHGFEKYYGSYEDLICLLYTSPSPRDLSTSRMPSSA